ncbi:hypothetical protein [Lichenibacterium ramalinae]|uniref:Glycerophosphoryl diester phosphodiesterase membrane domain-containing protein n=1 Tax=Lichenibacterium ramalinae TaxID=2316527 RepID=A0A4Q2RGG1_9HYPH|nr:hypothetical protein [Lichenibacterium ramalinae]RYB07568.1 hypothetical protein D3272_00025 [Lichenibacterium ramalinae]
MAAHQGFTVGNVLWRSCALLDRHGARLATAAALLVALPTLLTSLGGTGGEASLDGADGTVTGSFHVSSSNGGGVLLFLTQILFNGFVFATAFAEMRGERPDAKAALLAALQLYPPLLGIALLGALGIGLASLLLVVPGIMLVCAWIVAAPAYMAERPGMFAAFGRSRRITAGHRWPIFGLCAIYAVATGLSFTLGAGLLLSGLWASGSGSGLLTLASAAASAAVTLGGAVGTTAIYIELRRVEDASAAS